jgi:nucleoside-diphosphate-sugar epimerase
LFQHVKKTLTRDPTREVFQAGMSASISDFYESVRSGVPPTSGGEQGAQVLEWCERAAAPVSGEEIVHPPPPEPGPARPGEVVLTGANGFIGRHLAEDLVGRGHPVTAVVRRSFPLPEVLSSGAEAGTIRLCRGSLEDRESMVRAIAGAEVVVHLATGSHASEEAMQSSMVDGSVALAEACLEAGVSRFIYVSSIAALYLGRDGGAEVIDDQVPPDPHPDRRDLYDRGKILTENALMRLFRERGLPLIIARPGIVLGPERALRHGGVGLWTTNSNCVGWGRGDHPMPFVLVSDVSYALARMADTSIAGLEGKAFNLCSSVDLSARDLIDELAHVTGRNLTYHPRALFRSMALEVGKWMVKKLTRHPNAEWPSWRDIKHRELRPRFSARGARELLGWQPVESRGAFLDQAIGWLRSDD